MARFDDIYRENPSYFGHDPSSTLKEFHHLICRGGRVLDVGIGHGRNALFLARRGCSVVGIDASEVGVGIVLKASENEGLDIVAVRGDIMDFSPDPPPFDAVLALGMIQILRRDDVDALFARIPAWTAPGGLVFVSAFTVRDRRFEESRERWESIGRNSFRRGAGRVRTFLDPGEIITLLRGFKTIHHWEGLSPAHRHGDGPPERHAMAYLVAKKPS